MNIFQQLYRKVGALEKRWKTVEAFGRAQYRLVEGVEILWLEIIWDAHKISDQHIPSFWLSIVMTYLSPNQLHSSNKGEEW